MTASSTASSTEIEKQPPTALEQPMAQTPVSQAEPTEKESINPLESLDKDPKLVRCPNCNVCAVTRTEKHSGDTVT